METGRELFGRFLKGQQTRRPLYVPFLSALAARVGGLRFEAMTRDATLWTGALAKTADLFDLDGLVVGLDPTLLAEACGCQICWEGDRPRVAGPAAALTEAPEKTSRLKECFEAARRAFQVDRGRRGCVAALTGPVTLASQLFGPEEGPSRLSDAKQLVTRAAEAFCAERPDILLFLEGRDLAGAVTPAQRRAYNTLRNVAAYYNIPVALCALDYEPNQIAELTALKMDLYVLGPANGGALPDSSEVLRMADGALGVGVGLPLDDPARAGELIREWKALHQQGRVESFFFTSFEPEAGEVDLDGVHRISREIRETCL